MRESATARWGRRLGLTLVAAFTLFPLYVVVETSMKPLSDVSGPFRWLPSHVTFAPFIKMWSTIPLVHYFVNSAIVSVLATALSVLVAIFAGYAISRYQFMGQRVFSVTVLSTQMFPGILFLLPLFIIYVNLQNVVGVKLYGSLTGLIITYLTFALPFSIWMLAGYFSSIPHQLEEAAMVDGATPIRALFRVVLPVAKPGIVAVAVFAFITAWGEVLFASVLTTDATRTLAIGLEEYASRSIVYWNQLMAASIVVSLPVVVGFLALQRYLVRGLTAGSVK
ncbi:MAG: carbohydrate ABC transporter permease [Streptosporangiaceae bacterium]